MLWTPGLLSPVTASATARRPRVRARVARLVELAVGHQDRPGDRGPEGAFDGLLPAGTYVLGEGRTFEVVPGLTPTVVQREVGDGAQVKKKKKNKD